MAHRGGNSLAAVRAAVAAGADVLELDVQPGPRGRVEVRHASRIGPLPLLWDEGRVRRGWGAQLVLEQVLEAVDALPGEHRVMVDLKGEDVRLARAVAPLLAAARREVLVCGRHWPSLAELAGPPGVRVLLSAGDAREVAALRTAVAGGGRIGDGTAYGASLASAHVTADLVRELGELLELQVAWTVNDLEECDRVLAAGVTGVTTDSAAVLRRVVALHEP
ncbi:glycerophosphoryl diester phosphodiesterase [Motilibacter rhizosphaerae]|uniref:Glycerophosphoryl diester phosphodiesterase n=1 Tax=Motilibacter rhizosphaerae TaxID=598652 RepID=A0A4Q7NUV8_9ACTN|nr:hypothetical protein [Motilibacter rhizosphaerae]RZS91016.1 glycerophosphoryl diester phosphodiesterase [Motilibacter rhizosphaerae]